MKTEVESRSSLQADAASFTGTAKAVGPCELGLQQSFGTAVNFEEAYLKSTVSPQQFPVAPTPDRPKSASGSIDIP